MINHYYFNGVLRCSSFGITQALISKPKFGFWFQLSLRKYAIRGYVIQIQADALIAI